MPHAVAPISAGRAHHYKGYKPRKWPGTLISDISALWYRKPVVELYAHKPFSRWHLDTAPHSQQDCVNGSVAWARPALHCLCQKCLNCCNSIRSKRHNLCPSLWTFYITEFLSCWVWQVLSAFILLRGQQKVLGPFGTCAVLYKSSLWPLPPPKP